MNAIIWFLLFIYFIITLIPIKPFKSIIKTNWHLKVFIFHILTSILLIFSISCEYIINKQYLAFFLDIPLLAFVFSLLYFFILHKITTARNTKYEYDIQPISEETFKSVANLKYDYQMDENRLVFYKELDSNEKLFYVYDSSSKLYMECKN